MSQPAKPSWTADRMPCLGAWWRDLSTPRLAPDAPYLAALPAMIMGTMILLTLSGLVLAVYYNSHHAFSALQFIDRDVSDGWLVHEFHSIGTTMLFGAVYLYLFRALYTRAYRAPGELVWGLGVGMFSLLLLVGWLGYALTGGAVAFWSVAHATQTAGLLGGAPGALATWFFGGPDGSGTLGRLVVFHITLALALFGVVLLHRAATAAMRPAPTGKLVGFFPYYVAQYVAAFAVFALIFAILVFFAPHLGSNRLNLVAGSDLVVPAIIVPPWYLVPVSAIASVMPGTDGAIWVVVAALAVLFAMPWLDRSGPKARPGGLFKFLVLVLGLDIIGLVLVGMATPSLVSLILTVVFTAWYFLHFLVLTPLVTALETE
ncbi:MAG: cytochrome b N-terminal domain-containing protein [Acidocella sp.]|nr:cytochrome b N-terminal domain-containing protein [Acidocella sp.]